MSDEDAGNLGECTEEQMEQFKLVDGYIRTDGADRVGDYEMQLTGLLAESRLLVSVFLDGDVFLEGVRISEREWNTIVAFVEDRRARLRDLQQDAE